MLKINDLIWFEFDQPEQKGDLRESEEEIKQRKILEELGLEYETDYDMTDIIKEYQELELNPEVSYIYLKGDESYVPKNAVLIAETNELLGYKVIN